jgi:two-component system, OmpR family, sensor kinase
LIRTRLLLIFALLAALALAHAGFTLWSIQTSVRSAERSVLAKGMLNQYLELSANKQRLKVWLAQRTLAGDASAAERDRLLAAMSGSIEQLHTLTTRWIALASRNAGQGAEPAARQTALALLGSNLEAMRNALTAAPADSTMTAATAHRAHRDSAR